MIRSKTRKLLSLTALVLFIFALIFLSVNYNVKFGSLTGQVISEINAPEEEASIRFVIPIINAEHLDENKNFILDVYEELKDLDNIWSEQINDGEYVRVTFQIPLTSNRDITLYPRIVSGTPKIEVYEKDGNELIATFDSINSNEYNKVFLTNLQGSQDSFDLKILRGSIEIEHIYDPILIKYNKIYGVKK